MRRSIGTLNYAVSLGIISALLLFSAQLSFAQQSRGSYGSKISRKSIAKKGKAKKADGQQASSGETIGQPWTGEAGVSRSMADINLEQAAFGNLRFEKKKRATPKFRPDRKNLPQNEDSPFIAKYPIDSTTEPIKPEEGVSSFSPQAIGLNFDGGTLFDTLSFPPDTMGDVGPTQYIMAVNGWIRSFNKATGAADGVMNTDIDVFFNSVRNGSSTSDPRIRFDRLSQRWIIIIINVANTDNRVLVATSNSATITAGTVWTYFFFQHNTVSPARAAGCFADYPSLGVDANALYIGVNQFCPNNYAGSDAFVVRKSSILGAGPIVVSAFRNVATSSTAGLYTPQGVDNPTPGATEGYFIAVDTLTFGKLFMRRVTDPGGTPVISGNIQINVPATEFPITVPHLGNTLGVNGELDALDDRLYQASIRNGRITAAHNIAVNSAGTASSAGGRNGSRWYEIENLTTTPTLRQSGTWFDPAAATPKSFWIPSIAVSGQGHMALGGSSAGTNDRINAATIGRLSGDALGTLQSTATVTGSATAYNPAGDTGPTRRWGDYSYTSVDPSDDMTMWTIQQYNHTTNSYAVRVVKLIAPPPATPASAAPSTTAAGQSSVNIVITGTSVSGSGFFDPGAGFTNRLQVSISGGVTVNSVTYDSPTQITVNISTVGAAAGPKNITVTNPDGQALTGNSLLTISGAPANRAPYDFDGDGKSDVSVFRPSQNTWYLDRSQLGFTSVQFGAAGDLITPADYDGDNKADISVFRPSTGNWFRLNSTNGAFVAVQFGANGDIPVPADFDGDGKADVNVYRGSAGAWYRLNSNGGAFVATNFGLAGDIPVPADFDGDGKADINVFRPSGGNWFRLNSNGGAFVATQFGAAGDNPVQGDFDGDAKADIAVYRGSAGAWFRLNSSNGAFIATNFGLNGDIPTVGDYDGDGKSDISVFRPSSGSWFRLNSGNGAFFGQQFGLNGDKPTPGAYIQ